MSTLSIKNVVAIEGHEIRGEIEHEVQTVAIIKIVKDLVIH